MKRVINILILNGLLVLISCSSSANDNSTQSVNVTFKFSHDWDGTPVTNANFNSIQFTNANGESLSIEKLRYLISNITFYNLDGETIKIDGYNLIDLTNNASMSHSPIEQIPKGSYTNVSFTFGFNNNDNIDGAYPDLNSALWNVPSMLGGGYHYMQLEGKFIDNISTETGYQYHAIRAVDNSDPNNLVFQDTFFNVDLGEVTLTNNITFNIEMNIAEWFKNPNQWNLNTLHEALMPNFDAQIMMYENGQNVFNLNSVSQ